MTAKQNKALTNNKIKVSKIKTEGKKAAADFIIATVLVIIVFIAFVIIAILLTIVYTQVSKLKVSSSIITLLLISLAIAWLFIALLAITFIFAIIGGLFSGFNSKPDKYKTYFNGKLDDTTSPLVQYLHNIYDNSTRVQSVKKITDAIGTFFNIMLFILVLSSIAYFKLSSSGSKNLLLAAIVLIIISLAILIVAIVYLEITTSKVNKIHLESVKFLESTFSISTINAINKDISSANEHNKINTVSNTDDEK